MIDVTGMHEQMAQISAGLGLDGFAYCRHNPTGYAIHWAESPDGTRSLAVAPGRYADWPPVFKSSVPLTEKQLAELRADLQFRADPRPLTPEEIVKNAKPSGGEPRRAPVGAPLLLFGGSADYSLAPLYKPYPTEFLQQFKKVAPEFDVQFATPSRYLDAILPGIKSGAIKLPVMRGGTMFNYNAFWIQNPRVKSWFRRCEHQLQAAEMLATAASLRGQFEYPAQAFHHAWLLMCLNMDRNTLWGAAGGMVFEHERSWDARDRFEWVEQTARDIATRAAQFTLSLPVATSKPAATKEISLPAHHPDEVLLRQGLIPRPARSSASSSNPATANCSAAPPTSSSPSSRRRRSAFPPTTWWTGRSATAWPIRTSPRRSSLSAPVRRRRWWKRSRRSSAAAVCGAR